MGRGPPGESPLSASFGLHSELAHNDANGDNDIFPSYSRAVTNTHLRPLRFQVKCKHRANLLPISNPFYGERNRQHRYTLAVSDPLRTMDSRLVLKRNECSKCLILRASEHGKVGARLSDMSNNSSISDNLDTVLTFDAIIGIYDLPLGPFLAMVSDSDAVFQHPGILNLRQVMEVTLWPLSCSPMTTYNIDEGSENHYQDIKTVNDGPPYPTSKIKSRQQHFIDPDFQIQQQENDVQLLRQAFSSHQLYYELPEDDFHWSDVTMSVQRRILQERGGGNSSVLSGWRGADRRFFWNYDPMEPILQDIADDGDKELDLWVTPITSGFVQAVNGCKAASSKLDGELLKFTLLLISRRSVFRQGTRYNRRGIDSAGHVANFVETEQVTLFNDGTVASHLQVRGSIPLFWSSPVSLAYHPPVRLGVDETAATAALKLHLNELRKTYTAGGMIEEARPLSRRSSGSSGAVLKLFLVNLVNKRKDQGRLGKTFDRLLANAVSDEEEHNSTTHVWFDFHEETRREGLNSLAFLLDSVDDGFFLRTANGSIARLQHGLVRTNCMDCLDRTNVVQTLFAKRALHSQMKTWLLDKNSTAGSKFVRNSQKKGGLHETLTIKDEVESPVGDFSTPELEKAFRNVWSSNGDEMSLLYAGTPALKGDLTRLGRRTRYGRIMDGANSAIRYVLNNFFDHRRQEAVDLLLSGKSGVVSSRHLCHPIRNVKRRGTIVGLPSALDLDLWAQVNVTSDYHFMGGEAKQKVGSRTKWKQGETNRNSIDNDDGSSEDASCTSQSLADVPHSGMVGLRDPVSGIINTRSRLQYTSASVLALLVLSLNLSVSPGRFRSTLAMLLGVLLPLVTQMSL